MQIGGLPAPLRLKGTPLLWLAAMLSAPLLALGRPSRAGSMVEFLTILSSFSLASSNFSCLINGLILAEWAQHMGSTVSVEVSYPGCTGQDNELQSRLHGARGRDTRPAANRLPGSPQSTSGNPRDARWLTFPIPLPRRVPNAPPSLLPGSSPGQADPAPDNSSAAMPETAAGTLGRLPASAQGLTDQAEGGTSPQGDAAALYLEHGADPAQAAAERGRGSEAAHGGSFAPDNPAAAAAGRANVSQGVGGLDAQQERLPVTAAASSRALGNARGSLESPEEHASRPAGHQAGLAHSLRQPPEAPVFPSA